MACRHEPDEREFLPAVDRAIRPRHEWFHRPVAKRGWEVLPGPFLHESGCRVQSPRANQYRRDPTHEYGRGSGGAFGRHAALQGPVGAVKACPLWRAAAACVFERKENLAIVCPMAACGVGPTSMLL